MLRLLKMAKLRVDYSWTMMCLEYNIAELAAHQREADALIRRKNDIEHKMMSLETARSIIGRST